MHLSLKEAQTVIELARAHAETLGVTRSVLTKHIEEDELCPPNRQTSSFRHIRLAI
jgi:hypothetical protein